MNFKDLSESYFSGAQIERDQSLIEYITHSGLKIAPGATSMQMTFIAKGNGELEFHRRGDFMERGDAYPGIWKSRCQPNELEKVWEILGTLGPESFPARVADPGDPVSSIFGFYPNRVEALSWGPPDHSKKAPGKEILIAMAPLMNKAAEGEPDWAVGMGFSGITIVPGGLDIRVEFNNLGIRPIGIALTSPEFRGGFSFRYSLDRDVPPGVTRLPVEWTWCKLNIPNRDSELLWILHPGDPVTMTLHADLKLEANKRYIGKVQYEQVRYLDSLAGCPVLSGACFTDGFEFQT